MSVRKKRKNLKVHIHTIRTKFILISDILPVLATVPPNMKKIIRSKVAKETRRHYFFNAHYKLKSRIQSKLVLIQNILLVLGTYKHEKIRLLMAKKTWRNHIFRVSRADKTREIKSILECVIWLNSNSLEILCMSWVSASKGFYVSVFYRY